MESRDRCLFNACILYDQPLDLAGRHSSVCDAVGRDARNRRELVCERLGGLAAVSGSREEAE